MSDAELIELADEYVQRLSFYVAGWDYPESARREREAHQRCEAEARPVREEMQRRGLKCTRPGLVGMD
jgi:hypothetical protein